MALEVKYSEIRSEVITKLGEYAEEMVTNLNTLNTVVDSIPEYAEGDVIDAYINEYNDIVQKVYIALNTGLDNYTAQLESVCAEFEKVDAEMQSQISGAV